MCFAPRWRTEEGQDTARDFRGTNFRSTGTGRPAWNPALLQVRSGRAPQGEGIAMSVNEESVFAAAMEKQDPQERAAFLDRACAGDPDLRKNVESLLSAYDAGQFLEAPAAAPAATVAEPIRERPGTVIGPYKLLEQIG